MTTRWQLVTPEGGLQGQASDGKPTLKQLQEAVGGYIEYVELAPSYTHELEVLYGLPITETYVNEEARLMPERFAFNQLATSMLHPKYGAFILGCMVIVFSDEGES